MGDDRRRYPDQSVRPDQRGPVRRVRFIRSRREARNDRWRRGCSRLRQQDR